MNEASICASKGDILKAFNLLKSAKLLSFQVNNYLTQEKALILNQLANASYALKKYDEWL